MPRLVKSQVHPKGFPGGPPCRGWLNLNEIPMLARSNYPGLEFLRIGFRTNIERLKGRTNRSNAGKISVDRITRILSHLQYPDSTKSSAKDLSKVHVNL